ncbi:MAG: hypothetical protein ABFR95_02835 [Actinomycetota bacterium]
MGGSVVVGGNVVVVGAVVVDSASEVVVVEVLATVVCTPDVVVPISDTVVAVDPGADSVAEVQPPSITTTVTSVMNLVPLHTVNPRSSASASIVSWITFLGESRLRSSFYSSASTVLQEYP